MSGGAAETDPRADHSKGMMRRARRILIRASLNFIKDEGFDRCAAISYWALLSFLPSLALAALAGAWILGSPERLLDEILVGIEVVVPSVGPEAVHRAREELASGGVFLLLLVPILLWTASYAVQSVEMSLNQIMRAHEHRRLLTAKLKAMALLLVAGMALMFIPATQHVLLVIRGVFPEAISGTADRLGTVVLSELAIMLAALVTFAYTLITVPAVRIPFRRAFSVAVLATLAWEATRLLLARWLAAATGTSLLAGTFSFMIALLTWVYCTALILLMSAEILALLTGRRSLSASP